MYCKRLIRRTPWEKRIEFASFFENRIHDRLDTARELGGRCWFLRKEKLGEESPNSAGQCAG